MSIPIVFCGTPEFAIPSLESLHQDERFEIRVVLSQPDRPRGRGHKMQPSPVKARALELGLEVITPDKASAPDVIQSLEQLNCQVGVVVAYGQILSQKFIDTFPKGCVNIHSSLLPRWRGAAPMQRAIMAGDAHTGVSLQKVVKKLDAGPIIAEAKIPLAIEMGTMELATRLAKLGADLLCEQLENFVLGKSSLRKQDESLVSHAAKIDKSEAVIDWSQSALEIHNQVRALNMGGPYATCRYQNKFLKLHKTLPVLDLETFAKVGEIIDVSRDHFTVACGNGGLQVLIVQPESKARMSAADFIRGYGVKKGDQFE